MSIVELIGKRVLLKVNAPGGSYYRSSDVQEYRVLEVSPSGNWARLQNACGNKFWKPVAEIALVEVLRDLKAERPAD